jgi:hypothetical protein
MNSFSILALCRELEMPKFRKVIDEQKIDGMGADIDDKLMIFK